MALVARRQPLFRVEPLHGWMGLGVPSTMISAAGKPYTAIFATSANGSDQPMAGVVVAALAPMLGQHPSCGSSSRNRLISSK
jgi:hypothetical protein